MPGSIYLSPCAEVLFGDIYRSLPSVHVDERPLLVARYFKDGKDGRQMWGVHREDGQAPQGGFKWTIDKGGDDIITKAYLGMAIVLSHDCEIENEDRHRIIAMVRPITDVHADDRDSIRNFENWSAFPLPGDDHVGIPESYVDFRRITTVRPVVLAPDLRVASLVQDAREALAQRFWGYLMRPLEDQ